MLCVGLTVHVKGNSKVFHNIMVYEENSFGAYFKDVTLWKI